MTANNDNGYQILHYSTSRTSKTWQDKPKLCRLSSDGLSGNSMTFEGIFVGWRLILRLLKSKTKH